LVSRIPTPLLCPAPLVSPPMAFTWVRAKPPSTSPSPSHTTSLSTITATRPSFGDISPTSRNLPILRRYRPCLPPCHKRPYRPLCLPRQALKAPVTRSDKRQAYSGAPAQQHRIA
jgi:hypothetical protein